MTIHQTTLCDILNDHTDRNDFTLKNSLYYDQEEFSQLVSPQDSEKFLSIMNTNARSLVKHSSEYKVFLEMIQQSANFSFDVISFCETWLNESLEELVTMDNYVGIFKHKCPNKEGGGLGFFLKSDLSFKVRNDLSVPEELSSLFDCIFVDIDIGTSSKNIIVGNLYRSPSNQSEHLFTEALSTILDKVSMENKLLVLLGDVNIDLLKTHSHRPCTAYLDLMMSNGLIPAITLPTRVTYSSGTLIDHIFVNHTASQYLSGTITTDITDHFVNFILVPITSNKSKKPKHITYRKFTPEKISAFKQTLINTDWSTVKSCEDVDESYDRFISIYKHELDQHMPHKSVHFNKYKHKKEPWISQGILISTKTKDKLFKSYSKITRPMEKEMAHVKYKKYRNLLNRLIRKAKAIYWHGIFSEFKNNMKKTWENINIILNKKSKKMSLPENFYHRNSSLTDPSEIANAFNDFYVNVGPNLSQNMAASSLDHSNFLPPNSLNSNFFMFPNKRSSLL
jgi:hypothetical protein